MAEIYIHVRLRPGQDDDLMVWYEAQSDKSYQVRQALRAWMQGQVADAPESIIRQELARLPELLTGVLHAALADYHLPQVTSQTETSENLELAQRLDTQLADFFGEE